MSNPTAAMLVVGDEILSGQTRDANAHHLAVSLCEVGIDLIEIRIVADVEARIVNAINSLRFEFDHLFTSGGIGPTHDDITADSVAKAFGRDIGIRQDARKLLEDHYAPLGIELNDARLRMARIPVGATLIANPVSTAPGFSLENVHVMAGVPSIFKAMLAELLPRVASGHPLSSRAVNINLPEGTIAGPLARLATRFEGLTIGSYPFFENGRYGAKIVIRGNCNSAVDSVATELEEMFRAHIGDGAKR